MRGTKLQQATAAPGIVLVLLELLPPPHTPALPPRQCAGKGAENKAIPSPFSWLLQVTQTPGNSNNFYLWYCLLMGQPGNNLLAIRKQQFGLQEEKKGSPDHGLRERLASNHNLLRVCGKPLNSPLLTGMGGQGTAPHLLQAAPTCLLDELLWIHLLPNIISHIDCCLLKELERRWQEGLELSSQAVLG